MQLAKVLYPSSMKGVRADEGGGGGGAAGAAEDVFGRERVGDFGGIETGALVGDADDEGV